jgi:hypothetical protein
MCHSQQCPPCHLIPHCCCGYHSNILFHCLTFSSVTDLTHCRHVQQFFRETGFELAMLEQKRISKKQSIFTVLTLLSFIRLYLKFLCIWLTSAGNNGIYIWVTATCHLAGLAVSVVRIMWLSNLLHISVSYKVIFSSMINKILHCVRCCSMVPHVYSCWKCS